jgi:hypothetical protein
MLYGTAGPPGGESPFGAPARRAVRGRGRGREYIDPQGIRRDGWDRPILPDPVTGEVRSWVSVTTLARTQAEMYALNQWQQRMIVKGMGTRHDLAALAASTPLDDKATLQDIAEQAKEAAGAGHGRNMGTALHAATQEFDMASLAGKVEIFRRARPDIADDLRAYAKAKDALQLVVDPALTERMTVCRELECAGTFDRLIMCPDGVYRIADLKTGQKADEYGHYEMAQQFACYAHGEALWKVLDDATGEGVWEALPGPIDPMIGLLIWLPSGRAHCEIIPIDLSEGYHEALSSARTRQRRKAAKKWAGPPFYSSASSAPPAPAPTLVDLPPVATRNVSDVAPEMPTMVTSADVAILEPQCRAGCDLDVHRCGGCGAEVEHGEYPCAECALVPARDHVRAHPGDNAARLVLDNLLIDRIKGAPTTTSLMTLASENAEYMTGDVQAAAAERWGALSLAPITEDC